ncbi:MAG: AMP-binding protein [Candidatus Hermodarchaeota archaeon]
MAEWQVSEEKAWFKKWWPEKTPHNYNFEKITLGEFFERQRKKHANERMMWFLQSWMTYEEAGKMIDSFATALSNLNVKKGEVVALLLPNCFQYVIAYYACAKIGAIVTGVNPTYKPLEVLHHLEIAKAKYLIVLDALYKPLITPILKKISFEFIISTNVADLASGLPGAIKFIGKVIGKIPKGKVDYPSTYNFVDLIKNTEPNLPNVKIDPVNDTATYIMTGGTTGVPKATDLTHFNVVTNAIQSMLWFGGEDPGIGDVAVLPLFHSFGMTVCMNVGIALGGFIMLFPRPPETGEFLKDLDEIDAPNGLLYAGAEILFKRIADYPNLRKFKGLFGKLKLCISGAGPLHRPIRDAFIEKTGGRLVEGYGLSEASPVVCGGNLFGESPVGPIGLPFPGTDWGIWPSDAENLEDGPIAIGLPGSNYGEHYTGELCVCGPQVMKGYLNQPEETKSTLQKWDGRIWLRTGDIGFMAPDGTIVLRDRKKQLIKVAGHSVFPTEIETMIMKHKKVSEAAVAGLPDPEGKVGEVAKAWISLKPEFVGTITEDEMKIWLEEYLTNWKVPRYIEFINEVPKNILGKVQRRALQEADPFYKK